VNVPVFEFRCPGCRRTYPLFLGTAPLGRSAFSIKLAIGDLPEAFGTVLVMREIEEASTNEWSRLAKYEYGVWAFLVLAGVLALGWGLIQIH
jgi:hypothetical protein